MLKADSDWEAKYKRDHAAQLTSGPITFTPAQRSMNLQLMERVRALLPCDDEHKLSDCDLLYRFLIGKHWKIDVAEKFFRDYVSMRADRRLKGIVGEKMAPELEETMSPTFGTSSEGLPILWITPEPEKLIAAVKQYSSEEVIRTQIRVMEMTRLAQLHSGHDRNLCVIDLAYISMSTMNSMVMSFVKVLSGVLQEYYPEVFRRLIVFNTGWAVTGIWKIMKPFVDSRVQDKVKFFNTAPTVKSLAEFVPANQVLPRYGGASASNTVSALIDAEMRKIRDGPIAAAPALVVGTAAAVASPTSAVSPTTAASPNTANDPGLDISLDNSPVTPEPALEYESPRLLDVEADAALQDDTLDVQLFTARADSGSDSEAEAVGEVASQDWAQRQRAAEEALLSSPTVPPRHSLSMLTAGADFPSEPGMMRGLSAVYDTQTLSFADDINSCDLHSIDSASDDYDHPEDGDASDPLFVASAPAAHGKPTGASQELIYSTDGRGSVSSPKTPISSSRRSDAKLNTGASSPTTTAAAGDTHAFPTVVQINLTQRADRSVRGYIGNELVATCRGAHILSRELPPTTTPTGLTSTQTAQRHADPKSGSGQYVVGQLLVESGHPVHEFVLVCDASRYARFILRKSRFRSRLTVFQVIGDATVATDERGHHFIEGDRVRLAVGVPHTNGVASDWMLYGEDLSSTSRVKRTVRDLANNFKSTTNGENDGAWGKGADAGEEGGAHPNRRLLAECHGQTANFFGILASTHPIALFTLLVAVDRMWKGTTDTLDETDAGETLHSEHSINAEARDVVRSVKAFFRSGGRRTGSDADDAANPSAARSAPSEQPPSTSGEAESNSPGASARRFFKKLRGKES